MNWRILSRMSAVALIVAISAFFLRGMAENEPLAWANVHSKFTQTIYDAAGTSMSEPMELWWQGRNHWRITNLVSGSYVVANGQTMYKDLPNRRIALPMAQDQAFAPNAQLADRHVSWVIANAKKIKTDTIDGHVVDVYAYGGTDVDGPWTSTYWLDQTKEHFPLKVEETANGKPKLVITVTQVEHKAADMHAFDLPSDVPTDRYFEVSKTK